MKYELAFDVVLNSVVRVTIEARSLTDAISIGEERLKDIDMLDGPMNDADTWPDIEITEISISDNVPNLFEVNGDTVENL